MKRNGHLTEQLVLLNVTRLNFNVSANVIDSRTYSSYEVYDAQFTEKYVFAEELLNGYKEVANTSVRNLRNASRVWLLPKSIIPKKLAHEINADLIMSGTSA